jgi:hypothetical protein
MNRNERVEAVIHEAGKRLDALQTPARDEGEESEAPPT